MTTSGGKPEVFVIHDTREGRNKYYRGVLSKGWCGACKFHVASILVSFALVSYVIIDWIIPFKLG